MQDIRERVQRQWINHKHRDIFRGSIHCSTSPPSHRRISTISSTKGLPTQGTSTEDLGNTNLEYTTPLSTNNNLYTRGKAQQQSPLHLEGYQHNLHNHLYTRGITTSPNKRRFTTLGGLTKPQTNFSHKTTNQFFSQNKDPKDRIDRQLKCEKIKSLKIKITKKNSWEKLQIEI